MSDPVSQAERIIARAYRRERAFARVQDVLVWGMWLVAGSLFCYLVIASITAWVNGL